MCNYPIDACLFFLLQKRSMLGFNEFDEEEMLDLLVGTHADPVAAGGQFLMAGDARVGSSEPMDSGV